MGFMDTIKSKLGGNKSEVNGGIDKAPDVTDDTDGAHADKAHEGADESNDAVDKLPDA